MNEKKKKNNILLINKRVRYQERIIHMNYYLADG